MHITSCAPLTGTRPEELTGHVAIDQVSAEPNGPTDPRLQLLAHRQLALLQQVVERPLRDAQPLADLRDGVDGVAHDGPRIWRLALLQALRLAERPITAPPWSSFAAHDLFCHSLAYYSPLVQGQRIEVGRGRFPAPWPTVS